MKNILDPITFLEIERTAAKINSDQPEEDYKDAIVEVLADVRHLRDEEVDILFRQCTQYKQSNPLLATLADNFNQIFTRTK